MQSDTREGRGQSTIAGAGAQMPNSCHEYWGSLEVTPRGHSASGLLSEAARAPPFPQTHTGQVSTPTAFPELCQDSWKRPQSTGSAHGLETLQGGRCAGKCERTHSPAVKSSSHFLHLGGFSCQQLKVSPNTELGAQGKARQPRGEGGFKKGGMTGARTNPRAPAVTDTVQHLPQKDPGARRKR